VTSLWARTAPYGAWVAAALILVQTLPALDARWLWYSDEVRYAEVLSNLLTGGKWVVLELNGEVYPDKPPVYFLLLAGIQFATGLGVVETLFLGTAVSAILLIGAIWRLGRAFGLPIGARTAALLTLPGGLGMILLLHYVRMDLLFVALMLWGQALLHDHVVNERSRGAALAGFALLGLSVLTKGPLGAILPLAALLACAVWTGQARRLITAAMALGFGVMIGVLAIWALGVILVEGWSFFTQAIIGQQVVARATDAFHHKEPFWYYLRILPVVMLPWTGFVLAIPVRGFRAERLKQRRRKARPGDLLALCAATAFVLLSILDGKVAVYVLPVVCYVHLMIGIALTRTGQLAARLACAVLALLLAATALTYGLPVATQAGQVWAVPVLSGLLFALAITLVAIPSPEVRVMSIGGLSTAMGLVAATGIFPMLNETLSTKPLAEALMAEASTGADPMTYATYSGVFTFYAGRDLPEYRTPEAIRAAIDAPGTAVVLTPEEAWTPFRIDGMEVIRSQSIEGGRGTYLILRER